MWHCIIGWVTSVFLIKDDDDGFIYRVKQYKKNFPHGLLDLWISKQYNSSKHQIRSNSCSDTMSHPRTHKSWTNTHIQINQPNFSTYIIYSHIFNKWFEKGYVTTENTDSCKWKNLLISILKITLTQFMIHPFSCKNNQTPDIKNLLGRLWGVRWEMY